MGKLIVIEGTDGSGKATQTRLTVENLRSLGYKVKTYSFPGYTSTFFGREVGNFLNGDFGTIDQVDPKLASCLYALDRFEHKPHMEQDLEENDFVICDRYVESSMAHQGCKLDKPEEMFDWIERVEYKILGLPRPDQFIFLDVPVEISRELILKKEQRDYTDKDKDLHEGDDDHLQKAFDVYHILARRYAWQVISCTEKGELRPMNSINVDILNRFNLKM